MNRLALFDCDGTLVDSQHVICDAMESAFAKHRLTPPSRSDTRRVVGLSLIEAMAALLPEADRGTHVRLADDYKLAFQDLRRQGAILEPLFEGIVDLVDQLDAAGWMLGVATGKSDKGLAHCLDQHGLKGRFVTLQTADRHPSKPHPSMVYEAMADAGAGPATTVMIGDTSFDMLMGKSAGVYCVGVDWGYHHPDELWAAGADEVVGQTQSITRIMEKWS
ncbi:HAD-IA family hydrolase [Aquisediminimonas sediminicola]|uniref:HAD-IA family hydrolase n=1 Tax=Alteraquisediminimonas sediminicola TaxID=2676787 RepID=UPI001C8DC131|nr:HAD-IA family hydrolase [Aquisediminimonas sediminicola]